MTVIPPPRAPSQKGSPTQNALSPQPPVGDKERDIITGSEGTFLSEGTMWGAFYRTQGSLHGKEHLPVVQSLRCQGRPGGGGCWSASCLAAYHPETRLRTNGRRAPCTKVHTQLLMNSHSLAHSTEKHKSCFWMRNKCQRTKALCLGWNNLWNRREES